MNYKTGSGAYEVLYPRTTTGNVTDFASYMGNYYTKSQSDSKYATTSWVQRNYYTQSQTNSQINSIVSSQIGSFEDNVVEPIGTIKCTARTDLGNDWLLCNGQSFSSSDYPGLASLLPASATSAWQLVGSDKCPVSGHVYNIGGKYIKLSYEDTGNQLKVYYSDTYDLNSTWKFSIIKAPKAGSYQLTFTGDYIRGILTPTGDIVFNKNDSTFYVPLVYFNGGNGNYLAGGAAYSKDLKSWQFYTGTTYNEGAGYDYDDLNNYGKYIGATGGISGRKIVFCYSGFYFVVDDSGGVSCIYTQNTYYSAPDRCISLICEDDYVLQIVTEDVERGYYPVGFQYKNQNKRYASTYLGEYRDIKIAKGVSYKRDENTLIWGLPLKNSQSRYMFQINLNTLQMTEISGNTLKSSTPYNYNGIYHVGGKWYYTTWQDTSKIRVDSSEFPSGTGSVVSGTTIDQLVLGTGNVLYGIKGNNLYALPGGVVPNISGGSNYKYYIKGR